MAIAAYQLPVKTEPVVVSAHRGGLEIIDAMADEWRDLCADSVDDQPFYRPEWIRAYARAFAPDAKFVLITARLDGRLCMLLPLIQERTVFSGVPVRKLRAPVNAHPGRFDCACSSGSAGRFAISAAWKYLRKLDWDLLELRDALRGSTVCQLAAVARADGYHAVEVPAKPNAIVQIPASPELWKHMPSSAKLRSRLRQAKRLLSEKGVLEFHRVATADSRALERFYQLEASGWKGREGSAIACRPKTRQFYDEVAESCARFGYFSLYMLELNGHLIAGHFSLTHRTRCYSPRIAYDEDFKQYRPGHLIVSEILRDCEARGIHAYDITGPNDEWKMDWTSKVQQVNHHYVFKSPLGNLAHAIRFRLRPAIARQLKRKPKSA